MTGDAGRSKLVTTAAWGAAFLLSFLYLSSDWLTAWRNGNLSAAYGILVGRDFVNVFTGGQLVLQGLFATPYDVAAYSAFQDQMSGGLVRNHIYSYPPVTFLYVWLFGLFPYPVAYLLWLAITGGAFAIAARPYLAREGIPAWLSLVVPAAMINIWAGHYGFLIGALWLGAWRQLDERPRLAGFLIGLMIVKPHLAVLMPVLLIRRRAWTAFAAAAATVIGLIGLSALLFGLEPWRAYFGHTVGLHVAMVDDVEVFFLSMMPTVTPTLFRLALSPTFVWTVQALAGASAVAALWIRMPKDPLRAGLAGACATFLVLPYAFIYDMTVVSLAALIMLQGRMRLSPISVLLAALAFLLPLLTIFLSRANVPIAPLIVAGLLVLLLRDEASAPDREDRHFAPQPG